MPTSFALKVQFPGAAHCVTAAFGVIKMSSFRACALAIAGKPANSYLNWITLPTALFRTSRYCGSPWVLAVPPCMLPLAWVLGVSPQVLALQWALAGTSLLAQWAGLCLLLTTDAEFLDGHADVAFSRAAWTMFQQQQQQQQQQQCLQ